jgi:hypothetical protein
MPCRRHVLVRLERIAAVIPPRQEIRRFANTQTPLGRHSTWDAVAGHDVRSACGFNNAFLAKSICPVARWPKAGEQRLLEVPCGVAIADFIRYDGKRPVIPSNLKIQP